MQGAQCAGLRSLLLNVAIHKRQYTMYTCMGIQSNDQ